MNRIKTAQIGVGRWGKNILRNLTNLPECDLKYVCDANQDQIASHKQTWPDLEYITDPEIVFQDPEVEAIVIATPVSTHFQLAQKALQNNKHVFVEKPLVLKLDELEILTNLANKENLVLMEGHLLLYHSAFLGLKEAIDQGMIGEVHHLYFRRTNLGAIRLEANVLWDVGPHDFSVLLLLLNGQMPETIFASGVDHFLSKTEEVVFTTAIYPDGKIANFHESWIDPFKDRKVIVVGTKGILYLDEHATDGKIKLVKKSIIDTKNPIEHLRFTYQDDGIEAIPVSEAEPLKQEMQHFLNCITTQLPARSNPTNSKHVLQLLLSAQQSITSGKAINIEKK